MTEQRQHMENVMKELKSFGLSAKYAKDLESAWKKFTVWYSNNANTFKGGNTLLVHRTGEWHIHTGNWNKTKEMAIERSFRVHYGEASNLLG